MFLEERERERESLVYFCGIKECFFNLLTDVDVIIYNVSGCGVDLVGRYGSMTSNFL